jgi:type IV pilus assembly protein PilW
MHYPRLPKCQGLSLLEIFISLAISLLITLGMVQLFIHNKLAYQVDANLFILQENSHFISRHVKKIIQLSGYRSPPEAGAFAPRETLFPASAPAIEVGYQNQTNNSDSLTIRYQGSGDGQGTPDGTIRDCLNRPVDANQIATNIFSLNEQLQLQCQAINPSASPSDKTDILMDGLEKMQVVLGEDLTQDFSPNRYVAANYSALELERVTSLRIVFLLRTTKEVKATARSTEFDLLGLSYTSPQDRYLRKPLVMTVQLPNFMQKI